MDTEKARKIQKRRKFLKKVGVTSVGTALAGCGSQSGPVVTETDNQTEDETQETETEQADEDTPDEFNLQISIGENPTGLDPHMALGATGSIMNQAYERLLFIDRDGKVQPHLATDWERIEPGRARLYLRDGVKFHNGDEMTAEDVAFSLRRIIHEDVGGIAAAVSLTGLTDAEVVDGEHAVDLISDGLNTLVFKAVGGGGDIVQKSWIEERSSDEVSLEVNGTGPFKLEEYNQGEQILFSRFDDYWRGPAAASEVRFTWAGEASTRVSQLLADEVDFITNVPPDQANRVESNDGTGVKSGETNRILFCQLPNVFEPISSRKFRRALNYAINPQEIIDNVLSGFGEVVSQPALPQFFGYNPDLEPYPYDPEKAEQLVEESGHAGAEIELHNSVGRYLKDEAVAQATANQIDQLSNVSCEAKSREWSSFVSNIADGDMSNNPDLSQLGAESSEVDSAGYQASFFKSDSPLSGYQDEEIDERIQMALSEPDKETRREIIQETNKKLRDDAAWLLQHQVYAIWGLNDKIDWEPVPSEELYAYDMTPA